MIRIDLRSDTVTRPDASMRDAMARAEVGDDVYGDDPSVNALQQLAAVVSGKAAALFVTSGTQSNLLALMSHCERGDEYIVGQQAHTYCYEGGGAAVLGSIQPQPLPFAVDGTLDLAQVAAAIKPDDAHFARSRLLCLENTTAGKVLPLEYLSKAGEFARQHGLALHLDGARVANAAVASGVSIARICQPFDSVSICLSKGLGAPVGSVLCGSEALIKRAHRWRKVLGGGMRQAGIIAAAGIIALRDNVTRLAEDHRRCQWLATQLPQLRGVSLVGDGAQTNMVFIQVEPPLATALAARLAENNILITPLDPAGNTRLVIHKDIDDAALEFFVATLHALLA